MPKIIYNVTVKPHPSIAADWLRWMKEEHIPDMLATGCFSQARISRLIEPAEPDGETYSIQYFSESRAQYDLYIERYSAALRKKGIDKWGNKTIAFRSLMEVVH